MLRLVARLFDEDDARGRLVCLASRRGHTRGFINERRRRGVARGRVARLDSEEEFDPSKELAFEPAGEAEQVTGVAAPQGVASADE